MHADKIAPEKGGTVMIVAATAGSSHEYHGSTANGVTTKSDKRSDPFSYTFK